MRIRRSRFSHIQTSVPRGTINSLNAIVFKLQLIYSTVNQGWGQILEKGFKSKSKSFEIFQIQILSVSKGFKSKSKSFLKQEESAREWALCQLTECF